MPRPGAELAGVPRTDSDFTKMIPAPAAPAVPMKPRRVMLFFTIPPYALPTDCAPILARVGASSQRSALRINHDCLIATERATRDFYQAMPLSFECGPDLRPNRRLEAEPGSGVPNSRLLSSLLNVHSKVDQVEQNLDVALRLHISAHYSEREPWTAVAQNHGGHQCVKRSLAPREMIGI